MTGYTVGVQQKQLSVYGYDEGGLMRVKNEIINFLMITVGAIIAAFAIEDFLVPASHILN